MFDSKFNIAFFDLRLGKYLFSYQLNDDFFKDLTFALIEKVALTVNLELDKKNDTSAVGVISLKGTFVLPCDYCAEDLILPIEIEDTLLWTFVEHLTQPESPVDNWLLPKQEKIVNIGEWIYDVIASNIPLQRTHEPDCRKNIADFSEK